MPMEDSDNSLELSRTLSAIQTIAISQLHRNNATGTNASVEKAIRMKISDAEMQGTSTSLFIVGPIGSGKRGIVNRILDKYINLGKQRGIEGKVIATIRGSSTLNDSQALMSIANQFMYRDPVDKNPNIVLEDLEALLKQRRIEGLPALIVIENIDEFAKREKQTLIYTLLDLMHKSDMFITLICTSHCFNLHLMLEKRVMSRLNAQFVYISPANTEDICRYMKQMLTVTTDEVVAYLEGECSSEIDGESGKLQRSIVQNYNSSIQRIFGPSPDMETEGILPRKRKAKGTIYNVVECAVNWGKDMRFFTSSLLGLLAGLDESTSEITTAAVAEAIANQFDLAIGERLRELSHVDLHVLASIVRLLLQTQSIECSVSSIISEFDKLTGLIRKKEFQQCTIINSLSSLAAQGWILLSNKGGFRALASFNSNCNASSSQPGGSNLGGPSYKSGLLSAELISGQTLVMLIPPPEVVQDSFRLRKVGGTKESTMGMDANEVPALSNLYTAASHSKKSLSKAALIRLQEPTHSLPIRPGAGVTIPERVRRAILEPLEPVHIMENRR